MPLRDKVIAIGIPVTIVAVLTYLAISGSIERHEMALDHKLTKWQSVYHLDDGQKAEIKRIENEFHGRGNPLAVRKDHSPAEVREHHLTISKVMKPEDGSRFLHAMEGQKCAY
jgi:hypothetical protein